MRRWLSLTVLLLIGLSALALVFDFLSRGAASVRAQEIICKAGLPNLSRPGSVDPEYLGCTILSGRTRVSGLVSFGPESVSLLYNDLPQKSSPDGQLWLDCIHQDGCGLTGKHEVAVCFGGVEYVQAVGWVSQTPGHYGHLGQWDREFLVDRYEREGPPPVKLLDSLRQACAEGR